MPQAPTADKPPERLFLARAPTPLGEAMMVTDEDGFLRAFEWTDHAARLRPLMARYYGNTPMSEDSRVNAVTDAVGAYFSGRIDALASLAWRTAGTPFQQRVWRALADIPVGTTVSYGALAAAIGKPGAVRAVGLANGANPIGVIVPCHRVIGADGSLTGYGGGLDRKRWLLNHEGASFRDQAGPRAFAA
jgi:methylated-DNA-[protein]-cysteine S-methyltransferase